MLLGAADSNNWFIYVFRKCASYAVVCDSFKLISYCYCWHHIVVCPSVSPSVRLLCTVALRVGVGG